MTDVVGQAADPELKDNKLLISLGGLEDRREQEEKDDKYQGGGC